MSVVIASQKARICTWGNSEAVRIPKKYLKAAGLLPGDDIEIAITDGGSIEITPLKDTEHNHRSVKPAKGITFDNLFAGYTGDPKKDSACVWPGDSFVGAEKAAWLQ